MALATLPFDPVEGRFASALAVIVAGPFTVEAAVIYVAGAEKSLVSVGGADAATVYVAGAEKAKFV